jgi:hypothetical protein
MRKVKINWTDLEIAFERNSPEIESYLDVVSGEVISVTDGEADTPEKRRRIEDNAANFIKIEPASSREQYRWMEKFVSALPDAALRERLIIAIDGKGAFRRFKDVLLNYPTERERWFTYRGELLHYHIQGWLTQLQLEPINPPPWGHVEPPAEPEAVEVVPPANAEAPGEMLRRQAKEVIDAIPAVELPSAIAFLEFLRERGSNSLLANGKRPRVKTAPVPAAQVAAARAKAIAGAQAALASAGGEKGSTTAERPAFDPAHIDD